jgi:hypothetical protein
MRRRSELRTAQAAGRPGRASTGVAAGWYGREDYEAVCRAQSKVRARPSGNSTVGR